MSEFVLFILHLYSENSACNKLKCICNILNVFLVLLAVIFGDSVAYGVDSRL